ncbi:DUF4012 domain-containing protein [Cellulomonas sp. JZ18]|uniref:DUF4012 domain-containing protein n=1 Tax=Cellulomonas sp. JZ18 TaxID=2654191 RepID=UPI0012D40CFF|nr:DUF4012 domain-containing protein [Cellulomonas sp. JZ18]QGQ20248.1 DUF4012 domain-containing protein [Cellulomonas sp. JZ18]
MEHTGPAAPAASDDVRAGAAPAAAGHPLPPPRRRRRTVLLVVLVPLLLLVAAAAWVGVRVAQAADALQDARAALAGVEVDPRAAGALADGLADVRTHTSRARTAASDPLWRAAEVVPVAGDQLTAVRVVATAVDDLARDALPAVAELGALLDGGLRLPDGRVDVAAVDRGAAALGTAAATTAAAHDRLAALDPDRLLARLADPVREVQATVARADAALGPAARGVAVLPQLLGAQGPRTYLVLALNSAELRAPGGIVGAVTAVRVEDGAVTVVDQRSTLDLRSLDAPVLPLSPEEVATHTDRLGRWVQNAALTPHFPRTAELVAARWVRDVGGPVDGVVATDPVAIAGLVDVVGPVPHPDGGELGADGFVRALLRDVYLRHPENVSDAVFGAVAAGVVAAVGEGRGSAPDLVAALARAVDERRLRVWSAHPPEQDVLAASVVGAAFLDAPFAADAGLFLDDASQGKLGLDLSTAVTFRDARCEGPAPRVTAVLSLDFRPPADVASLPRGVVGSPDLGVPPGTLTTIVSAWSPAGGDPLALRRDGTAVGGTSTTLGGRHVQQVRSVLAPGAQQEIAVDLPLRDGAVTVWTTPTVTSPGVASFRCG